MEENVKTFHMVENAMKNKEIPAVNIIQAQEILFIHYLKTSWTVACPLLFSIPLLQVTLILYDFNPVQTKPNYM